MNYKNLLILSIVISIFSSLLSGCNDVNVKVDELLCEYRKNPLGIDNINPRLSWKITDLKNVRGQKQTAYQILVSSNKENIEKNVGDLWDSGKVNSDQNVNVVYAGKSLESGMECFWKVKVWDVSGRESDWSEIEKFSIGLLNPSDWQGKWIYKDDQSKTDHNWYRKTFELADTPERAMVYVGSLGYHELYVNGKKVTDWIMNPASSYLKKRVLYLTYDVTDRLKKGKNVIAIWHAAGWTRWKRIREYRNPPFAFIAQADIECQDGNISIGTDETWKCSKSYSSYYGNWDILDFGGEIVDDRLRNDNWCCENYDDSSWKNASIYEQKESDAEKDKNVRMKEDTQIANGEFSRNGGRITAQLSSQILEPQVKYREIVPIKVSENSDGTYLIDMGENYTGTFEMNMFNGHEGDSVLFEISDRPEVRSNWQQKSKYIYGKSGKGKFENRFNLAGGRWITVYGLSYKPSIDDIRGYVITSDRKQISSFESSSELLNQIYKINLDTYLANTIDGILVDCPHRERRGWGEVTVAAMYGDALPNFESGAYMEQYSQYMRDAQFADGRIRGIINEEDRSFLMWKANNPLTIWETYRMYGDKKLLSDNYDSMKRWMEWLFSNSDFEHNGALKAGKQGSRGFPGLGDWCTPRGNFWDSSNSPEAVHFNNCLYALMLEYACNISCELGKEQDNKIFSERLSVQREATHEMTYDPTTGKYGSGQQMNQAFALLSGVTPDSEKKKVYDCLVQNVLYDYPYYDTGSSGQGAYTRYFIEKGERMDLIYQLLKDTHHPSYGYFIKQGVNVWPERWSAVGNSRIHTCYTGIGGYFIKGFGGIRPSEKNDGMKTFIIKPVITDDLTYINTSYKSLYGKIVVNQKKIDGKLYYHVEVPVNTTARLYLQATGSDVVLESGKNVTESKCVKYVGNENSDAVGKYVIYEIESGIYDFEVNEVPETSFPKSMYMVNNLAKISRVNVSSMFIASEKNPGFEGFKLNDGDDKTTWKSNGNRNEYVELEWILPQKFSKVKINEIGNNIQDYSLEYYKDGEWMKIEGGKGCGSLKEISFEEVFTNKLRLIMDNLNSMVEISEFEVLK